MSPPDHDGTSPPFLPNDLIEDSLFVLQKVLWEANRCYERACYNACAAMIRRLFENLVVEAFEHHGIADQIKKDGKYLEFRSVNWKGHERVKVEAYKKRILPDLKFFGDIGAHNRMILVKKDDLDRLHQSIRSGLEELLRNL